MTKDELIQLFNSPVDLILIQHENMKDTAFWPLSFELGDDIYKITGIWYNTINNELICAQPGNLTREVINIKKEELEKWKPTTI
jgi:hypothetical protein